MRDFEKRGQEFDRSFERSRRWGIIFSIVITAIGLGLTGFGIWVIVMLLRFFGVV